MFLQHCTVFQLLCCVNFAHSRIIKVPAPPIFFSTKWSNENLPVIVKCICGRTRRVCRVLVPRSTRGTRRVLSGGDLNGQTADDLLPPDLFWSCWPEPVLAGITPTISRTHLHHDRWGWITSSDSRRSADDWNGICCSAPWAHLLLAWWSVKTETLSEGRSLWASAVDLWAARLYWVWNCAVTSYT